MTFYILLHGVGNLLAFGVLIHAARTLFRATIVSFYTEAVAEAFPPVKSTFSRRFRDAIIPSLIDSFKSFAKYYPDWHADSTTAALADHVAGRESKDEEDEDDEDTTDSLPEPPCLREIGDNFFKLWNSVS